MKRSVEVLVLAAAIAATTAAASAHAAQPVVRIRADASLRAPRGAGAPTSVLHVAVSFGTDTPGAQPFTIRRAVIYFPDHGTDGQLFPSCSARQIDGFRGDVRRCPRGSKIGSGTVKARALGLGVTATGQVALFNGPHGRSVTFNVQTYLPAYINRSFDAPIAKLRGSRYPEKLTLEVPPSLQQIIDGVFVAVQEFDVTIDGAVRAHGVQRSYLAARTCPRWPMHGVFDFLDSSTGQAATATTDARLRCSDRQPASTAAIVKHAVAPPVSSTIVQNQ